MVAVIAANGHWSRGGLDGGDLAGDALVRRAEDGSGEASVVVGLADMEGGEAFRGFGLDGYIVDGG